MVPKIQTSSPVIPRLLAALICEGQGGSAVVPHRAEEVPRSSLPSLAVVSLAPALLPAECRHMEAALAQYVLSFPGGSAAVSALKDYVNLGSNIE